VLRERTERPEGILSGNALLVGRDPDRIVATVERLLTDERSLVQMAQRSLPYGDGHAADRISAVIADWLGDHSATGSVAAAAA
jgi:UDP-N-acetylglucosamine 2-epimerase